MVGSRATTAIAGLAASVLVSVAAWYYFDTVLLFLLVPFVPFLLRRGTGNVGERPPVRECPTCGFTTRDPEFEYCPRDGRRLT